MPPADWPPAALVEVLRGEKRARGRPPNAPAAASPGPAHQIAELRTLILGLCDATTRQHRNLVERLECIERALAPERTNGEAVKKGGTSATVPAMPPLEPDA